MSMGLLSSIDVDFWRSLFDSPLRVLVNSLDILIVAFLIYRFIRALRGTKIMTLVQGVVLFIFVKIISDFIGFTTISYLMNQVINYGAIAAVVIFAPDFVQHLRHLDGHLSIFCKIKRSVQMRNWFRLLSRPSSI